MDKLQVNILIIFYYFTIYSYQLTFPFKKIICVRYPLQHSNKTNALNSIIMTLHIIVIITIFSCFLLSIIYKFEYLRLKFISLSIWSMLNINVLEYICAEVANLIDILYNAICELYTNLKCSMGVAKIVSELF